MTSHTTTLILALTLGICGGMLVISAAGALSGYLLRRHWMAKREMSIQRARTQAWNPTAAPTQTDGLPSFRPYVNPQHVNLQDVPVSANVPTSPFAQSQLPLSLCAGPQPLLPTNTTNTTSSPPAPVLSLPPTDSDNVRFPPAVHDGASRSQTQSSKVKLNLSKSSMRKASLRYSRLSQNMLARLPSHFKSGRLSRCVSLESGESLGMPEDQIPMARRIQRKEQRFQYDSSSYSSSIGTPEDGFHMPETDTIVPPPPAVLKKKETETDEALQQRIKAWQEASVLVRTPESDAHSQLAELPPSKWRTNPSRLVRESTLSSTHSLGSESIGSHTTMSDVINPYLSSNTPTPLVRIPSIRPQFMAETSLESWLGPDNPRQNQVRTAPTPSPSALFGEVQMGGPPVSESHVPASSTEHGATERMSSSAETSLPRASFAAPEAKPASSPVADVQLYLHPVEPDQIEQHISSYARTSSSRSSYRSSARFSGMSRDRWKHMSGGTASTELTWVDEVPETTKPLPQQQHDERAVRISMPTEPQKVQPDRLGVPAPPRRDISTATSIVNVGYAYDPTEDGHVYEPTPRIPSYKNAPSTPKMMPDASLMPTPNRTAHSASPVSTASSESVATEQGTESRTIMSPNPILGSPMETMQAWFQMSGDKTPRHDVASPTGPRAVV